MHSLRNATPISSNSPFSQIKMLKATIKPYTLNFAFTAHTSRETFTEKQTYFFEVYDDKSPDMRGVGEVAVFPSLMPSFHSTNDFREELSYVAENINDYINGRPLPENSAIRFGLETALADYAHGGRGLLYESEALQTLIKDGIRINGLVWMNDYDTMRSQLLQKIDEGFKCIKLKIGAIGFDEELKLIKEIRSNYSLRELEIRVDANGAFNSHNVYRHLETLAHYDIHSIEQPIPRDDEGMADVCRYSPIPVALDEDMIERWWTTEQMSCWLQKLKPSYIVLKPSLVGGFEHTDKWIYVAKELGIGWWVTSALESNIGLSAIAQWLSTHPGATDMAHGLGTGKIYTNNPDGLVCLKGERIYLINE